MCCRAELPISNNTGFCDAATLCYANPLLRRTASVDSHSNETTVFVTRKRVDGKNRIRASVNRGAHSARWVFPDHNEIVPKETPLRAQAPVGMLAARVRQASQFTSVESQSIVVTLAPGEMSIAASGGDGRAQVRLSVEYDGKEEKIGFNPAYLLDALKVIDGETVAFGMTDRHAAATLKDGSGFVYVLMPVIVD